MKEIRWAVQPAFALLLAAGSVYAADAPPAGGALEPCKADIQKFCRAVEPGGGRIIGCLKEHREEVSDTCKARLAQMRVKRKPRAGTPP